MIGEREIELINREIDSVNSEDERLELNSRLGQDEEARILFEDLRRVQKILAAEPTFEPPAYLKRFILNSLPAAQASRPRRSQRFPFSSRFRLVGVGLAAAGFALGVLVSLLLLRGAPDGPGRVYGTLASHGVSERLESGGRALFTLPTGSGSVSLRQSAERVLVELRLDSRDPVSVRLEYPDGSLAFNSFAGDPAGLDNIRPGRNSVTIDGTRSNPLMIVFDRPHNSQVPVTVSVLSSHSTLFGKTMVIEPSPVPD